MKRRRSLFVGAVALGLFAQNGCDLASGSIGAPCETAEDCDSGLICDEHDGKASCQEPHSHGDEEPDDSAPESTSTTGPGDDDGADDPDTGGSSTGAPESTDSTGSDLDDLEAICSSLCACLSANCSELDGYPFSDEGACLDDCMTLQPGVASCFSGFCEDVPTSGASAEHNCLHAWGELGSVEC